MEDELRAQNAVLKLKLEMEHGMEMSDTSELPPEIENQWLRNIQAFEEQFERNESISVFEFIGNPSFTPLESLTSDQLPGAIAELMGLLEENGIVLEFCCDYDDEVVYRFITTEFFPYEIDNIRMEGGAHVFSYEEFHPNHEYDLRRTSANFIMRVLSKEWSEYDIYFLSDSVTFHSKTFTRSGMSSIISFFQCCHSDLALEQFSIQNVHVDLENRKAVVRGDIVYCATHPGMKTEVVEGPCIIHFMLGNLDWEIVQFDIPGL